MQDRLLSMKVAELESVKTLTTCVNWKRLMVNLLKVSIMFIFHQKSRSLRFPSRTLKMTTNSTLNLVILFTKKLPLLKRKFLSKARNQSSPIPATISMKLRKFLDIKNHVYSTTCILASSAFLKMVAPRNSYLLSSLLTAEELKSLKANTFSNRSSLMLLITEVFLTIVTWQRLSIWKKTKLNNQSLKIWNSLKMLSIFSKSILRNLLCQCWFPNVNNICTLKSLRWLRLMHTNKRHSFMISVGIMIGN